MKSAFDRERNYRPGFWALMATQCQGVFSDNLLRWMLVFLFVETGLYASDGMSEESRTSVITGISTILFSLPFILFPGTVGALSDRFSKQRIILGTKVFEIVVMAFGGLALWAGRPNLLWVTLFLLTLQSAVFSPAKYGILPEILPDRRLSWGNGVLQMGTMVAVIAGTGTAGAVFEFLYDRSIVPFISVVLVLLAFSGFTMARRISRPAAVSPAQTIPLNPYKGFGRYISAIQRDRWLGLVVLAWTFLWFAGALVQQNIITLGHAALELTPTQMSVAQTMLALGIALGALGAGSMSRGKIEVGLIPLGAMGLTFFCGMLSLSFLGFTSVLILLFALGFSSGVFFVPVAATLQRRAPEELRGGIVATANVFSSLAIFLAGVAYFLLGRAGISPYTVFLMTSVLALGICIYVCVSTPVFVLRLFLWGLSNSLYRIRVQGRQHIPDRGGALLVANHTSFLDALVIIASIDRPVRFIMYQGIYEVAWIKPLAKLMGAIPVTPGGGPREVVQSLRTATEAIKNGELVCIFAEGQITRTGQMLPFRKGFERVMKDVDAPIIPVHIDQIWSGIFSFAGEKISWKWPSRIPFPITVGFGKGMTSDSNAYELRMAIQELGTEAYESRSLEHPLLHRVFIGIARRYPLKPCVADGRSGSLTYLKTLIGSVVLARKLQGLLGPEQMVGVLLPQGVGCTLVNIALPLMGKVPVNLNYTAPNEVIEKSAVQCGMKQVITARAFLEQVPVKPPGESILVEDILKSVEKKDRVKAALWGLFAPVKRLERSLGAPANRSSEELATVIFSSGSEGEPKGIMLSHYNVLMNIESAIEVFPHEKWDRVVGILPIFHSFGYTGTLWAVLTQKLCAVYHPNPLEARAIGDLIQEYQGKILFSTSTFLQGFIRRCSENQLKSLRFIVTGAEKLAPRVRDAFKEKFGVEPLEGYGTTECAPIVSLNIPDFRAPGFYQKGTKRGSIGHPIPGVSVRIIDPDTRDVLQNGAAGLLMVKGPNIMKGYLNQPEKTDTVLQDGWYETGDIATIDEDGFITITDRLARFSKIAGEMVSHTKIEEELHKLLNTSDRMVAVAGVPDESKGERLVVLHTLADEQYDDIIGRLEETGLPNLWIPKAKAFYKVDEIPILGTGKMDLKAVKNLARQLDIGE